MQQLAPMRPQVGPDSVRSNALLQLLVHMGKRDAFNILRTQQQVVGRERGV